LSGVTPTFATIVKHFANSSERNSFYCVHYRVTVGIVVVILEIGGIWLKMRKMFIYHC